MTLLVVIAELLPTFQRFSLKCLTNQKARPCGAQEHNPTECVFAESWRGMLEQTPNLDFYQEMVSGLLVAGTKIVGVKTSLGLEIKSRAVILTNGTFLNGLIHIGEKQFGGGRAGEKASFGITEALTAKGFESGRMKTGTPPRVDGRSLDYSLMTPQPGDKKPLNFLTQTQLNLFPNSSIVI